MVGRNHSPHKLPHKRSELNPMAIRLKCVLGVALGVCLISDVVIAQVGSPPPTPSPIIPHVVPGKPGSRQFIDFFVFSWQEFYALNWPSKADPDGLPQRGVADTSKNLSDLDVPRVWETWKADYELFPAQPADGKVVKPTPWNSWDVAVPICKTETGLKLLPLVAKGESVLPGAVNQGMGGPLVDQHGNYVRYEIRMNQSEYEETVDKSWFLRKNLAKYPTPPNLFKASQPDSYGALELKAAWRIMTDEEKKAQPPRYYMTQAQVLDPKTRACDGKTVAVGLVGFHIAHKTDPFKGWVWSTFEQVDNVPNPKRPKPALGYSLYDDKDQSTSLEEWGFAPAGKFRPVDPSNLSPTPTPVQTIRLNPIPDAIATLNDQVHALPGIKGTVWEFYELVETQWQGILDPIKVSSPKPVGGKVEDLYPQLKALPTPDAIANTTMETFFQGFKGLPPVPAKNKVGVSTFGTSCMHCHYRAAQYDFSWMLADQAWPSAPASQQGLKAP
jgi:hypothetical protein